MSDNTSDRPARRQRRPFGMSGCSAGMFAGLFAAGAGMLAWLAWECGHSGSVPYLPRRGSAEWVLYPSPADARPRLCIEMDTVFRRSFHVAKRPSSAILSVAAFRRFSVMMNGGAVEFPAAPAGDWKRVRSVEVASRLKEGENEIIVTVWNESGPPALWLSLEGPGEMLPSDASWMASYTGAAWRPAQRAGDPIAIQPESALSGGETLVEAWRQRSPLFGGFAVLSLGLVTIGGRLWRWWGARTAGQANFRLAGFLHDPPRVLLAVIILLYGALFVHNIGLLPRGTGFDARQHLDYVEHIIRHGALPLANDGFEMHQPPLYYLLAALLLGGCGLSTLQTEGVLLLRYASLALAAAHLVVVYRGFRLLFPGDPRRQCVGILLAALLPAHLYLSHYPTNETLAAFFVTASLYQALKLSRQEVPSYRTAAMLGLCLGAGLLTKLTVLLAVPVVFGALVVCGWNRRGDRLLRAWSGRIAVAAAIGLAVSGWHYGRVWINLGGNFTGHADYGYGSAWWQLDGYRTSDYYLRGGQALTQPFFSGFHSYGDGLYSTLWGDGLWGGASARDTRPPWNYDLMAAGYWLALAPTLAMLMGVGVMLGRLIRQPRAEEMLLLGLLAAVGAALLWLGLRVPSFALAKAFYGLPALFPLCVAGAMGWDLVARRQRMAGLGLLLLIGVWAINGYGTWWVRGGTAATLAGLGRDVAREQSHAEAAVKFRAALEAEPGHPSASLGLAASLIALGQGTEAVGAVEAALRYHPGLASAQVNYATVLESVGKPDEARAGYRRALELQPGEPRASRGLASLLLGEGREAEAIEICRAGLRLEPQSPELHLLLGMALKQQGRAVAEVSHRSGAAATVLRSANPGGDRAAGTAEAVRHLRIAGLLSPRAMEPVYHLAWIRATHPEPGIRNGSEAVLLAEAACVRTRNSEERMLSVLAAAYAEVGRFPEAVAAAEKALKLAESTGRRQLAAQLQEMLAEFRAGRAYRD